MSKSCSSIPALSWMRPARPDRNPPPNQPGVLGSTIASQSRQPGWSRLDHSQAEALDMIAHKIGRILAGDPNHADHWDDIAGYARLVARRVG
jgi:hypothetical protein